MRYTFFLYNDENDFTDISDEKMQQSIAAYGAYIGALKEAGVFIDTDWLKPSHTATTISLKTGDRIVQDGPYAETKEQLGGFFIVEVKDLDEALNWAEKCPSAHYGIIEVRPSAM